MHHLNACNYCGNVDGAVNRLTVTDCINIRMVVGDVINLGKTMIKQNKDALVGNPTRGKNTNNGPLFS